MGSNSILIANFSETWGGGEAMLLSIASELARRDYTVSVVTSPGSELEKRVIIDNNLNSISIESDKFSFLNPLKILEVRSIIKRAGATNIIVNGSVELKHFTFANSPKISSIIYRRGFYKTIKNTRLNRFLIKKIDHLVAVSKFTYENSLKHIADMAEVNVEVINNGITLESGCSEAIDYDSRAIIAIGRLERSKRFDILISSMPQIISKIPNATLSIIGVGKESDNLSRLIRSLNLEKHVLLKGFSSNIPYELSKASLLVHPARVEAFGVVYLEAMRQKLPVIGVKGSSADNIIINNSTGLIVEDGSKNDLSNSISSILDDPNRLKEFGADGYLHFLTNFTIDKTVNKFIKLFK